MQRAELEARFLECAHDLRPMLWRLAGGYTRAAQQEDLLQEILLQIWRALPRFEGRAKLSTWAYRVGLLTAMNWARKDRREHPPEDLEDHPEPAAVGADPATRDTLARALELIRTRLSEVDRAVLLLALEELPRAEMAQILGLSVNATTVRLSRARERLSSLLDTEIQR